MAEWYVSALAVGGGTGAVGAPWTFGEARVADNAAAVANGDRVNVKTDGTYTIPNSTWSRACAATSWITWQGYTAVIGDGGIPTIIRQAGGAGNWLTMAAAHYRTFEDMKFDANGVGNNAGIGVEPSPAIFFINCEFHNMTAFAAYSVDDGNAVNCFWYNSRTAIAMTIENCLFDGVDKSYHGFSSCTVNNSIVLRANQAIVASLSFGSIAYDCVMGFNPSNYNQVAQNCIAAECGLGYNAGGTWLAVNCCSFNNTNPDDVDVMFVNKNTSDPQFVDPTAPAYDFTRSGDNLSDEGLSQVGLQTPNYGVDIGVDQRLESEVPVVGDVRKGTGYVDHGVAKVGTMEAVTLELPLDVVVEDEQLVVEVNV